MKKTFAFATLEKSASSYCKDIPSDEHGAASGIYIIHFFFCSVIIIFDFLKHR